MTTVKKPTTEKVEDVQGNPQKSTSEQLKEILSRLSVEQLRFVAIMQQCATKTEAATLLKIEPNTIYKWPSVVNDAIRLAALDREETAREIGRKFLVKAMMVKVKALDSDDEILRQRVATEIIEWNIGKAMQKTDVTNSDGSLAPPNAVRIIPYVEDD